MKKGEPVTERRILVTGSRDLTNQWQVWRDLDAELDNGPFVLVHGACSFGADAFASQWARAHGIKQDPHPADWKRYRLRAGPIRNAEMVALGADRCYAYPRGRSPGTRGCVRLAESAGIPVMVRET